MTSISFVVLLVTLIHFVATEDNLCANSTLIKTRSCSTQILGSDQNYESCKVETFPPNSMTCKHMEFGPIMPNGHIGGVSLKPSIIRNHLKSSNLKYNENYTVLNITFTNIKWKTMKFRFQRYSHGAFTMKNHCRNVIISSDVTLTDQSVFYYDCYWSSTDGDYNGQNYMLDFEATDDKVINRGQFYFNVPTSKTLELDIPIQEWKPFTYIEIHTGTLKLHIFPPPDHINIKLFRIEVVKACDKRTNCEEIVTNTTLNVDDFGDEIVYEYNVLRNRGSYHFIVTPIHIKCVENKYECQTVRSPTVFINNEMPEATYICIASITALVVATLFAYYIALRVVRKYWFKEYNLALGKDVATPPKILVVYSSSNKLHAECVASFVNYLRTEYGLDVMYDGDIATTSHGDPYLWTQEVFKLATHVMYVIGPAEDNIAYNIYDKPLIGVHRNVDTLQLHLLKTYRFKKNIVNIMFEYSDGRIPIETCHEKVFFLLRDWQKLITYLSKNLLPKQQMLRTERGRCFLEDLKRAKKLLNTKTNGVIIKIENCKVNSNEKKVLL